MAPMDFRIRTNIDSRESGIYIGAWKSYAGQNAWNVSQYGEWTCIEIVTKAIDKIDLSHLFDKLSFTSFYLIKLSRWWNLKSFPE